MGTLTIQQRSRLALLENTIERGLATFAEVGAALAEIKEQRLYQDGYGSFERYLDERWKLGKSRAYQLISAAATVAVIKDSAGSPSSTMVDDDGQPESLIPLPENERQVRPLEDLPEEQRGEAWEQAVESANGQQPTAKQVEAIVSDIKDEKPKKNGQAKFTPKRVEKGWNEVVAGLTEAQDHWGRSTELERARHFLREAYDSWKKYWQQNTK